MPPPSLSAKVSPPLVRQLATEEKEAPVQPAAEPENTHVGIKNRTTQESLQMPLSVPSPQRTHAHPPRHVSKADVSRDSGNWSQSSGVLSQQHHCIMACPHSPRKAGDHDELAVLEGEDEVDISVDMGRKSIASATYHTANEEEEEEREIVAEAEAEADAQKQELEASMISFGQSSPFQEHVTGMPEGRNSTGRSSAHSANVASSPLRVLPVAERRKPRTGASDVAVKNAEDVEELQVQQEEMEKSQIQQDGVEVENMDIHPPSSPPAPVEAIEAAKQRVSNLRQTPSPLKEVEQLASSLVPAEPEHHPLTTASGSPMTDEASPVPAFIRKSSLSFPSLPPRGRISTTTTEAVKLGGAGRSSWLQGRRTLGRSLGGRLTTPRENPVIEDSAENSSTTEKPRERKRSRGGVEYDALVEAEKAPEERRGEKEEEELVASKGGRRSSRKKSRSASYKGSDEELSVLPMQREDGATLGDGMDTGDDVGSKVAEHNKSASQRLQERIQQLGKLHSAARITTSLSSAQEAQSQLVETAELMYPDLPQVKEASKSHTSAPQEQLQQQWDSQSAKEPSVEGDWIPPVRSASVRTVVTASKSSTNLGQSTPRTKNQALRDRITKKPSEPSLEDALQKKSRGELNPSGRSDLPQSLTSNTVNSPHNAASPVHAAGARFEDKVSIPLSPKPGNKKGFVATLSSLQKSTTNEESPVTAVKSQTANAFKRAKEIFTKTNALGSPASAESLKSGSRLGHKSSLGSIGRSSSPRTPQGQTPNTGTPNREIYPDLGDMMEEERDITIKSKRQMRGSKNKDLLQKQQEEEKALAREVQEARRLKEEGEQAQKAAAEEKARQEEKVRLEEKRWSAEQRRKEKELQKQLAAQKKAEEEARIQKEKEERGEQMRRHREELQRKEEELKRLIEEQRQKREAEARLRQEHEEEMRRQEMERRKWEEEEGRVRKEAEEAETRRVAEQEAEEARKHAELEGLRRKQDEDLRRKQDAEERRKRETTPIQEPESDEVIEPPAAPVGSTNASRIRSAMGGRPPSRLQPPSGGKRPPRPQPPQKAERGKPTPVSIQVGTASQRAAMDRQKPVVPPPTALLSAMKDTFAPKERPVTAEPALAQSNSAPNLKKSTSTQLIAASASASNLRKASTMDEKKKEENRRLIEARREEVRRKEAAAAVAEEERRKAVAQQGRRAVERVDTLDVFLDG